MGKLEGEDSLQVCGGGGGEEGGVRKWRQGVGRPVSPHFIAAELNHP